MAICIDKRRKTDASGSSPLPDEMMTEVFLRLPVESLLRFRAVCRSWAETLSSDEFCSLHMAKANADPAPFRLLFVAPTTGYGSTSIHACSPSGSGPCWVDTLFTMDELRGGFIGPVAAQCRGLTLLYDVVAPAYYVLNAATRAVTRLPPCPDVLRSSAGLGYDSRTKEYKAIRLFTQSCYDEQLGRYSLHAKCEIYTLGLGGSTGCADQWRLASGAGGGGPSSLFNKATQAALANADFEKLTPVLANGSLHWLLLPLFQNTCPGVSIMSFSVTDETFGWIRSPPFVTSRAHLVELDGHLCMARDPSTSTSSRMVEIWKLQDYSASGVWSLHHRINLPLSGDDILQPLEVVTRVLGAVGNGSGRSGKKKKIIIATTSPLHKEVHAYDAMSGALETDILSPIGEYTTSPVQMSLLTESLAPVRRTNTEIAMSSPVGKAFKEILLRLPAKSVIQSKAVCTQWRRLVEGETFIRSYFVHKKKMWDKQGPRIMLVGSKGTAEESPCFQFIPLEKWLSADTTSRAGAWLQAKVVCSKPCHGLNLVSTADKDYVFNPCTGYHMTMSYPPRSLVIPTRPWKMPTHGVDGCRIQQQDYSAFSLGGSKNIGLGFNPMTQEHMAVIILYQRKDFKSRRYRLTCFLWNGSLTEGPDPPLPPNDMPPAYVDGVLYWVSDPWLGPSNTKQALVLFDLARRGFDVVPCPSRVSDKNRGGHGCFAVELQGMLCVVLADPVADELEIWKRRGQDDLQWEWDRAYTICLKQWPGYSLVSNGIVVPMSMDPRDGRILLSTGRKVGLYDPADRTLETLCALGGEMPELSSNNNNTGELRLSKKSRLDRSISSQCSEPPEEHSLLQDPPSLNKCSSKEISARSSTTSVLPVPMLYEESLVSYPRARKRRPLEL